MGSSPYGHLQAGSAGPAQIALSAAAEASNAIVVYGQIKDLSGASVAEARDVQIVAVAPTAGKGAITVVNDHGTEKVTVHDEAGKVQRSVLTSLDDGSFQVSIADDQAEKVTLFAIANGCLAASLEITFA